MSMNRVAPSSFSITAGSSAGLRLAGEAVEVTISISTVKVFRRAVKPKFLKGGFRGNERFALPWADSISVNASFSVSDLTPPGLDLIVGLAAGGVRNAREPARVFVWRGRSRGVRRGAPYPGGCGGGRVEPGSQYPGADQASCFSQA